MPDNDAIQNEEDTISLSDAPRLFDNICEIPTSTSTQSTTSTPSSGKVAGNASIARRSFFSNDKDYALIFIPELCHLPDLLQVRACIVHWVTQTLFDTDEDCYRGLERKSDLT